MADIDIQSQVFIKESEKSMSQDSSIESNNFHKLSDTWILWAHLPHDTDWSIKSYIKICPFARKSVV